MPNVRFVESVPFILFKNFNVDSIFVEIPICQKCADVFGKRFTATEILQKMRLPTEEDVSKVQGGKFWCPGCNEPLGHV